MDLLKKVSKANKELKNFKEYRKKENEERSNEVKQERIDNNKSITAPVLPQALKAKLERKKVMAEQNAEGAKM